MWYLNAANIVRLPQHSHHLFCCSLFCLLQLACSTLKLFALDMSFTTTEWLWLLEIIAHIGSLPLANQFFLCVHILDWGLCKLTQTNLPKCTKDKSPAPSFKHYLPYLKIAEPAGSIFSLKSCEVTLCSRWDGQTECTSVTSWLPSWVRLRHTVVWIERIECIEGSPFPYHTTQEPGGIH